MNNEPKVEFDYEQVDRDLGYREPGEIEQDDRALETFKLIAGWIMRPGNGGSRLTQELFGMRIDIVCWLLAPRKQSGVSETTLSQLHGVPRGTITSEASRLRKHLRGLATACRVPSAGLGRRGDKRSDHIKTADEA